MADANLLVKKLGTIQRTLIFWLRERDGKEVCAVDYCDQNSLRKAERDRVYKAVQSLKLRGLVKSAKAGRHSILSLTGAGHAAAYLILEDNGQMRLPGLPQATILGGKQ